MKVFVTPLPCCLIVLILAGICAKVSSEKCSFDTMKMAASLTSGL